MCQNVSNPNGSHSTLKDVYILFIDNFFEYLYEFPRYLVEKTNYQQNVDYNFC